MATVNQPNKRLIVSNFAVVPSNGCASPYLPSPAISRSRARFSLMPASKFSTAKVSFGEWARQSGSAKPSSSVSTPRISLKLCTMGMEPPSRIKTAWPREGFRQGSLGRPAESRVGVHSVGFPAMPLPDFECDRGRRLLAQMFRDQSEGIHRILVRHQPEGQFRKGLPGDDSLGPIPLVAAADAVDLDGRPSPNPLQRAVARLAE